MKHEIFDTVLNVTDSDVTFVKIYKKEYIPTEYLDDIKKANLRVYEKISVNKILL